MFSSVWVILFASLWLSVAHFASTAIIVFVLWLIITQSISPLLVMSLPCSSIVFSVFGAMYCDACFTATSMFLRLEGSRRAGSAGFYLKLRRMGAQYSG